MGKHLLASYPLFGYGEGLLLNRYSKTCLSKISFQHHAFFAFINHYRGADSILFCFIIMKKVLLIAAIVIIFASCEDSNPHEPSNDNIIELPGGNNSIDNTQIIEFQDPITKAICTLYWDLNKDGELSYSEASVVTDILTVFKYSSIVTFNELKYFTGLTTIGKSAFDECDNLISITIPDSVTTIGSSAFRDCSSLTSVTIPDSVTTIGDYAFNNCSSLTSVTIPDGVTTIGDNTFYYCTSLTSVTIDDSVTSIGDYAFSYCSSLTSVTIPDSVTTIGNYTFYKCSSLTSVYCKPTTPPVALYSGYAYWEAFDYNASGRKIYVPMGSVEAYKTSYWSGYASAIEGYNF